jgi:hypothetical protein
VDQQRRCCSGDGCTLRARSQSLLASGTKRSLSQLLRYGAENRGIPSGGYPVSTTASTGTSMARFKANLNPTVVACRVSGDLFTCVRVAEREAVCVITL